MQLEFTGHQSGIWASLAAVLGQASQSKVSAMVHGKYTLSQQVDHLDGIVVAARTFGYARNISLRTPLQLDLSVGCPHSMDEDFAADSLTFTFDLPPTATAAGSPDSLALALIREWNGSLKTSELCNALLKGIGSSSPQWPYVLAARLLAPPDFICGLATEIYSSVSEVALEPRAAEILHMNLYHEINQLPSPEEKDALLQLMEDALCSDAVPTCVLPYVCELFSWCVPSGPSERLLTKHIALLSHASEDVRQSAASTLTNWLDRDAHLNDAQYGLLQRVVPMLLHHPSAKLQLAGIGMVGKLLLHGQKTREEAWRLLVSAARDGDAAASDGSIASFRQSMYVSLIWCAVL